MKFVQAMGLLVLIALGAPPPTLTRKWADALRRSDALAGRLVKLEKQGTRLEDLPVMPLDDVKPGMAGVVCDEVRVERGYWPVCLGVDAVYLTGMH